MIASKFVKNTKTGTVLKIKKIEENSVSLLVYQTDTDIINTSMLTVPLDDIYSLIIPAVLQKLGDDYVASETDINWLFENAGRLFRMKVDKNLFIFETQSKTDLGLVLQYQADKLSEFVINQIESKYGLTYLQTFEPQYVSMFQPLVNNGMVILEKLEIDEFGKKSVRVITDLNEFNLNVS